MTNLFSRLSKISESNRLKLMCRNLAPFYQSQLGLAEIKTIDELVEKGKKLELRRYFVDNYVPPPRRNQTLEPDLAYIASSSTSSVSSIENRNERKCWNCNTGSPPSVVNHVVSIAIVAGNLMLRFVNAHGAL